MPIIQVNIFVCEFCENTESVSEDVRIYDDPVISPPEEKGVWDYINNKLACPKCLIAEMRKETL